MRAAALKDCFSSIAIDFFTVQKYNNLIQDAQWKDGKIQKRAAFVLINERKRKTMKVKYIASAIMMAVTIIMTGCAGKSTLSNTTAEDGNSSIKNQFGKENDNQKEDGEKLSFEEIEELAANNVYAVTWYAEDDSFSSGTAFLLDSEQFDEKLLVTAFHFLMPEDDSSFTGEDLPEYLQGGQIFYDHSFEPTGASIRNCVVMEDAASFPEVDKDVAAFTIQGNDSLKTLPLTTHEVKKGDTIYLLANLWDTDDVHENCVYECKVKRTDDDCVYYELDSRYGTTGASGGPIINEYGEVIGIHMGTIGGSKVAHSSESFLKQINNGTISDITYPEISEEDKDEEEGKVLEFERDEEIETIFFNLQIDKVEVTDTIGDIEAEDGYEFLVLDLRMRANEQYSDEPIDMYYDDFIVVMTGGDYDYSLETGLDDAQLEDEYTITSDSDTTGKMIYAIPKGEERVGFCYNDYYFEDDSDEMFYGDTYIIEIPVENWSR